ncbi:MAG: TonB-dependent receptor [Bacteroidetes bacterium]|nr:TonB-dependent receptor [Bacteroidota bacterium]
MRTLSLTGLLIFSIAPFLLSGQSSLSGTLTDTEDQPLAFANVLLLQASDSLLVKGTLVEESGDWTFSNLPSGEYILRFQMVGYATKTSSAFALEAGEDKVLEPEVLEENVTQLDEVQVIARKPLFEQQMDRLVVNVENSVTLAGGTALDILERSPGVVVNRQNKTLGMGGKDGVIVMINGKMTRMDVTAVVQMLAGMNASNIQKIELITTPPSNFDAEGNAGIINIVLKDNPEEGFNGSATVFAGYGYGEKYGGSVNFNLRQSKVNFYGSYSYSFDHSPQLFTNYRSVVQNGTTVETYTESLRDPDQIDNNARLGLDVDLGEKTVLGLLATAYDSYWRMDATNNIEIREDGSLVQSIEIPNDEINRWRHLGGNLNLQHSFRESEVLTFDADYLFFHDNNPTNYTNNYYDANGDFDFSDKLRVSKITPINIYVSRLDYRRKLGEKINLETGIKGTLSQFTNDVQVDENLGTEWMPVTAFTAKYFLEEKIGAAYASLSYQISDKWSSKAGLRYEYTDSQLDSEEEQGIVDRQYGNLFPTFYLSYNINENNSVQLAYNRRIQRPTFNDLAPFVIFLDPNTFFSGNPALQPAISDGVRLEYRWKNFMTALGYNFEQNTISNFQPYIDPETNVQTIASANMKDTRTVSLMLSLPFYIGDWWVMQNNLMGFWNRNNLPYGETLLSLDQASVRGSISNMFTLPKGFTIEIGGFFSSTSLFGFQKIEPFGALNAGIQKSFGNNGGTLSFSVQDIFRTGNWRVSASDPALNLDYEGFYRFSARVFRLSYTRDFGSNQVKSARQRNTGAEEERNRVN